MTERLSDLLQLQSVLTISPYPQNIRQEFAVIGRCVSDEYVIVADPIVIGQYAMHGKMALRVMVHIVPAGSR